MRKVTMPNRLIFQAVTKDNHLTTVRHLLGLPCPMRIVISVAFLTESGISSIQTALLPVADRTIVIAGVRNGITSAQALRACLAIGCTTYVVDTGSRHVLFHPKVYFSRNAKEARLIVGSANLTTGGLISNIESSLYLDLGLAAKENVSLIKDVEVKFDRLIASYPEHVLQVKDDAFIQDLLDSGRLADESIRTAPLGTALSRNRDLDTVPKMNLQTGTFAKQGFTPVQRPVTPPPGEPTHGPTTLSTSSKQHRLTLVWQSQPLTRRDLTIPTGLNTNPTGSMLFGKGALDGIDHRHYFRENVFAKLEWHFDTVSRTSHYERAFTRFHFIIRGVDYGPHTLQLSHNTRTDTTAYTQRNSMTQLHWGEARQIIAHEDLLDRTLFLYRDDAQDDLFILEID